MRNNIREYPCQILLFIRTENKILAYTQILSSELYKMSCQNQYESYELQECDGYGIQTLSSALFASFNLTFVEYETGCSFL